MEIYVYGINSLRTQGDQGGRLKWYIAASVPSAREDTKFFLTIITSKDDGAEEFLDRQAAMHTQILNEDLPVLNNMRFDELLRSEEHTSELQSLMRISYAVFCLKKKKSTTIKIRYTNNKEY